MKTMKLLSMAAALTILSTVAFADGSVTAPNSKAFPKGAPVATAVAADGMKCKTETVTAADLSGGRGHGKRLVTYTRHACPSCKSVEKVAAGKLRDRKVVHLCATAGACCK